MYKMYKKHLCVCIIHCFVLYCFVLSKIFVEIKVEDNDEFRIKSEPENVHLVMENDEHRKGYEFEEFCMKIKLEHLCLGTAKGNYFVM